MDKGIAIIAVPLPDSGQRHAELLAQQLHWMGGVVVQRDPLVHRILGAAIAIHRELGPGLFESIYRDCLVQELQGERLQVRREVVLPVVYKGVTRGRGFRVDLMIESRVVLEVKSVATLLPLHDAQILTYMKLSGLRRGLLINFNVTRLMDGVKSFLN